MTGNKHKISHHSNKPDIFIAITLGVLAIGCFIVQIIISQNQVTQRETTLFNLLQLLLTTGFSWYGARAISVGAFQASIKRFALGAYRRITDIDSIIGRLQDKLRENTFGREKSGSNSEFGIVLAMVEDTRQIINSSIADWTDVIGEELLTFQEVKVLEEKLLSQEEKSITVDANIALEQHKLETKIADLRDMLPTKMKIMDRPSRFSKHNIDKHVRLYARIHKAEKGLVLECVSGSDFGSYDISKQLKVGDELTAVIEGNHGIDLIDSSSNLLGRLKNTVSPGSYDNFEKILIQCYGSTKLKVAFVEFNRRNPDEQLIWFNVRVLDSLIV